MAIIKKLEMFSFDFDKNDGATVGNNRMIERRRADDERPTIRCFLHGHNVATFKKMDDGIQVSLSPCGYLTHTTMSAIDDFCSAMGLPYRASRAGGKFTVWSRGEEFRIKHDPEAVVTFLHEVE